jgi:hypothetical protein
VAGRSGGKLKLEGPARHQPWFHSIIFGIQVPQESVNDLSERKREQIQCVPGISFRTLTFQKVEAGGPTKQARCDGDFDVPTHFLKKRFEEEEEEEPI